MDVHVAAALDAVGGLLGTASFPTTPAGYKQLQRWLTGFGPVTGMKHMPTEAFSSVPMTISRSRSERIFQPSACVQNRASPGRS